MDRIQLQKERARLQAALDGYDSATTLLAPAENGEPEREPAGDRHPGLRQRIANLDSRIALAHDI